MHMKKKVIAIAAVVAVAVIAAVVVIVIKNIKYKSHYVVTTCIQSNTSKSASVSFGTLKGTMVFTLRCDGKEGRCIRYTGKLGSGNITVYCDKDGTKTELFKIKDGEEIENTVGDLSKGKIYIIVETDGKVSDGKFKFEIE